MGLQENPGMRMFFTLLELQPILLRLTFERSAQFAEDGTPTQVVAPRTDRLGDVRLRC